GLGGVAAAPNNLDREPSPLSDWGSNWLGYSRYDGVVVTADALAAAPEPVRTALWQYAEAGGTLAILGKGPSVPAGCEATRRDVEGLAVYDAGFGHCLVTADDKYPDWPGQRWGTLSEMWHDTPSAWTQMQTTADANRRFRVVDNLQVPVRGLFVLMLGFAVLI